MIKRILMIALAAMMVVALAACAGTDYDYNYDLEQLDWPLAVVFTVVYEDGSSEQLEFTTMNAYLGGALLEAGLIEGEETPMGLMITHVAGMRADFVLDNAWWQFLVNGEMSMTGVSDIRIDPAAVYEFRFTPA